MITEIDLPGLGTIGGFSGKKEDNYFYIILFQIILTLERFILTNLMQKSLICIKNQILILILMNIPASKCFIFQKIFTKVPMIITYKKGLQLNGNNPTILYGYGGFNISLTPSFSITNAVWMEQRIGICLILI